MPYSFSFHSSCHEILVYLDFYLFYGFYPDLHVYFIDIGTNRRVYWISKIEKCINLICVLSQSSSLMQNVKLCQFNQSWITSTTTCQQRGPDYILLIWLATFWLNDSSFPDSEVDGAYMGPTWGRQDPGGPHVGPMLLIIWVVSTHWGRHKMANVFWITFRNTITQTQDIFSLADAAWKHPKCPCFCILPLEFEFNIDIYKHKNSEVIYSNRNKSIRGMFGNSKLQKPRKTW